MEEAEHSDYRISDSIFNKQDIQKSENKDDWKSKDYQCIDI